MTGMNGIFSPPQSATGEGFNRFNAWVFAQPPLPTHCKPEA